MGVVGTASRGAGNGAAGRLMRSASARALVVLFDEVVSGRRRVPRLRPESGVGDVLSHHPIWTMLKSRRRVTPTPPGGRVDHANPRAGE
jgi:hypothetical protein